jgi:hypothetical protein
MDLAKIGLAGIALNPGAVLDGDTPVGVSGDSEAGE